MYFEDRSTDCYREFVRILKIALDRISPQIVTNVPIPIPGSQHEDLLELLDSCAAFRQRPCRAASCRQSTSRTSRRGGPSRRRRSRDCTCGISGSAPGCRLRTPWSRGRYVLLAVISACARYSERDQAHSPRCSSLCSMARRPADSSPCSRRPE
ncbi:hypothetical protein PHLGIDRAFT_218889 [Phlebiopsis gigantea 11061_1 CR5-6]|uniref:Uncharacterized protein n=1 Tax=Phlebiopsis gigantea (strain 11061_1 CR5-6) TaxID=745531 RepID=A0A0C3PSX3_PHLG1|nr:hypothetical protein PHLGIDRAFT_218889 [Phlebiopsis gigantea 11061_1 CR5-6]